MRHAIKCLFIGISFATTCATAFAQDKVVYHIDNAEAQATKGLRNVRNHLDVAPDTKIVVVTHADGVDFLMEGAKDKKNPNVEYASLVSALKARGVRFEICEITLKNRNLKKELFTLDTEFTHIGCGAHWPTAGARRLWLHQTLSAWREPCLDQCATVARSM